MPPPASADPPREPASAEPPGPFAEPTGPPGPFAELTGPPGPFAELTGQDAVVAQLRRASAAATAVLAGERPEPGAMTHAWLFTGPPGSGRSVAARAFAAALLCPSGGCGQCPSCLQVQAGTHADLLLVRPEGLSYGVKQTRDLVLRAAGAPPDVVTELIKDRIREVLPDPVPRTAEANTGSFPAIPNGPGAGNGSRAANAANGNAGNAADVADRR